jgi:hypothetical protein
MFFGITINPSIYAQAEYGGVTHKLVQHDGQTSPYGGENQIPMSLQELAKPFYKIKSQSRDNIFWHLK